MGSLMLLLRCTVFAILLAWSVKAIDINYTEDGSSISVLNDDGDEISKMVITGMPLRGLSKDCSGSRKDYVCRDWGALKFDGRTFEYCISVNTSVVPGDPKVEIYYEFNTSGHVYSSSEQFYQYWPIDDVVQDNYASITNHEDHQGVVQRYWLTTEAKYYYVGPLSPLFVTLNIDNRGNSTLRPKSNFSMLTQTTDPYPSRILLHNFTYCKFPDAREAHLYAVEKHFKKPSGLPDNLMLKYPIWSTWARYKKYINATVVENFAEEILNHGFKNSQLQIDDSWESCYGSLTFDPKRFPDMKTLSDKLKGLGFRLTLWIHPFINTDCEPYYSEALDAGYFVQNALNETETSWWNGNASVIDFTNEEAVQWWTGRIRNMMNANGIDSLKFDAGETSLLPQLPVLTGDIQLQPNIYTQKYVETAATFGEMVEVRVGFETQNYPLFVRMLDKDSRWDFQNGLPTLISTLFTLNIAGYPFVIPDKVGGNGYDGPPSKELFIRWLQATVFMPAIQYSYVPWDFDKETVEISKQYTEMHERISPIIEEAMRKALLGVPVNTPIWWISPKDPDAQVINDEFLLGEDILIAPVLEEGAVKRDIYLPAGRWVDKNSKIIEGPVWLRNYTAKLEDLPVFVLESSSLSSDFIWGKGSATSYSSGLLPIFILSMYTFLRIWF